MDSYITSLFKKSTDVFETESVISFAGSLLKMSLSSSQCQAKAGVRSSILVPYRSRRDSITSAIFFAFPGASARN